MTDKIPGEQTKGLIFFFKQLWIEKDKTACNKKKNAFDKHQDRWSYLYKNNENWWD